MVVLREGFLRELEVAYQREGRDYHLFPGRIGKLPADAVVPVGIYKAWDRTVALESFKALELAAGVRHVQKRGFHGFRRSAVDVLVAEGATTAELQAAGSWKTSQIPLELYRSSINDGDAERAADLLEQARGRTRSGRDLSTRPEVDVNYPESYPALAQLLKAKNLTDAEVSEVLELSEWAWVELNYRPHAYQA
jgi:hypothetical protein